MERPLSCHAAAALAPLGREFYQRSTVAVARELLGKLLLRDLGGTLCALRLTEVEAYLGAADPACHTWGGRRTARNQAMWGEGGRLYVYFTYGMHYCANVVTRREGEPEAVLLRGAVAVLGREVMVARRGGRGGRALANGPAKICQALAIDRSLDGADLIRRGEVWLADDGLGCRDGWVQARPRVGVAYAGEAAAWPLRFLVDLGAPAAMQEGGAGAPGAGAAGA